MVKLLSKKSLNIRRPALCRIVKAGMLKRNGRYVLSAKLLDSERQEMAMLKIRIGCENFPEKLASVNTSLYLVV